MANDVSQIKSPNVIKKKQDLANCTQILADHTFKNFPFFYLRISLVTLQRPSKPNDVDELTVKKNFTAAMVQRFGVIGAAVTCDILTIAGDSAWVRVPFEDRSIAIEALSSWNGNGIAWMIKESSCWLGGMTGSDGRDLFDD